MLVSCGLPVAFKVLPRAFEVPTIRTKASNASLCIVRRFFGIGLLLSISSKVEERLSLWSLSYAVLVALLRQHWCDRRNRTVNSRAGILSILTVFPMQHAPSDFHIETVAVWIVSGGKYAKHCLV